MQLLAHCNGDMAAEQYMDQLETVYRELGSGNSRKPGFYRGDIRPVMIHAQLLGLDQLERVKKLGVIPSCLLYTSMSMSSSMSGREAGEADVPSPKAVPAAVTSYSIIYSSFQSSASSSRRTAMAAGHLLDVYKRQLPGYIWLRKEHSEEESDYGSEEVGYGNHERGL